MKSKDIIKSVSVLIFGAVLSGCTSDNPEENTPLQQGRNIEVNFVNTRTTIDYEGGDLSHLVWQNGDKVAYISDFGNDIFKTATVAGNKFNANVPAEATGNNRLYVIWPVDGNEGKNLTDASAELKSEFEQNVDERFDGSLLPMFASVAIPENSNSVNAVYEPLGVVVRLSVKSYIDHETEVIKKVTLSANEKITGSFVFDPLSAEGWTFVGTSNSITTTISGDNAILEHEPYIYFVLNRGKYTGVKVEIETDLSRYAVEDGTMDLTQPGRTLFRVDVPLEEVPAAQEPAYRMVRNVGEITAGGKYLLVSEKDDSQYYVGVLQSNNLTSVETLKKNTEGEVDPASVDNSYIWKIEPQANNLFTLYSNNVGKYAGIPMKYYTEFVSGRNYISYFTYNSIDENENIFWGILIEDNTTVIKNDFNPEGSTYLKFNLSSDNPFGLITEAISNDYPNWKEVKILKYQE